MVARDQTPAPGGSRRSRVLPLGAAAADLTIVTMDGAEAGPTVWLLGAVHGDELVGVEAVRRVLDTLEPARLRGTVVAVPVANPIGVSEGRRYLHERADLNRGFPGKQDGTASQRAAAVLWEEAVDGADAGIDFHTAPRGRMNYPHVRTAGDDTLSERLARSFGTGLRLTKVGPRGSLRNAGHEFGQTVLTYEGGEPAVFDPLAITVAVDGARRVLGALGMIDDAPAPDPQPQRTASASTWVRAPVHGLWRPSVTSGDEVATGARLGWIGGPLAVEGTAVESPTDGVVIGLRRDPAVHAGMALAHVTTVDVSHERGK